VLHLINKEEEKTWWPPGTNNMKVGVIVINILKIIIIVS
jgi:hypothetical protein